MRAIPKNLTRKCLSLYLYVDPKVVYSYLQLSPDRLKSKVKGRNFEIYDASFS